ncbi:MAG TPA: hypothetical protein VGM27_09840, partial [Acidobacteriaceae bacterium]
MKQSKKPKTQTALNRKAPDLPAGLPVLEDSVEFFRSREVVLRDHTVENVTLQMLAAISVRVDSCRLSRIS